MSDDPAQYEIGSEHEFERAGVRRTFKRLPDGWNELDRLFYGGRYLDDESFDSEGWSIVSPKKVP